MNLVLLTPNLKPFNGFQLIFEGEDEIPNSL